MSALHAHFLLRNQQAFQRLLDASIRAQPASTAAPLSSSGGKSWNRPSPLSSSPYVPPCDVNARDWLGRTVLHLAVSSADPAAVEYVRLLLTHPRIDVNLADTESRWTALHRALYVGNLTVCVLLLQRSDIDTSLKDYEGYTAFDVYNSTVEGTKPEDFDSTDLFTWGANRNAALGLGDGDDRVFPEQLVIEPLKGQRDAEKSSLSERFSPIRVKQVAMSKLHTVVITSESKPGNLRVCGFGSGGRLGLGQHTQYSLVPIAQLQHEITAVALGQDHTLAITKGGDVLSWGLNRFSQLGYVIEPSSSGVLHRNFANADEPIQAVPRRIYGPLKKEIVRGVAACKTASACWTDEELFTWGTNSGQLGYDKNAQPVQILPRKVTPLTQPVIDVAITDAAMACLLESKDVVCFWNGKNFKINFPTQSFPSEIQAYRPPMALNNASIAKVVSCDYTFSALSRNGEMFTFSLNPPPSVSETSQGKTGQSVKPQRVWALRKQFSAVKDVALGTDGSIILCTESGHVYVRSRNAKGGQTAGAKTFKFQRMPFLQRVVRVSANSTGAFGVLRSDSKPKAINIVGNSLSQDLAGIQPFTAFDTSEGIQGHGGHHIVSEATKDDDDDVGDDSSILQDVQLVKDFCDLLISDENMRQDGRYLFADAKNRHGADLLVITKSGFQVPVHRVILASRSTGLYKVLLGESLQDKSLLVEFSGCLPAKDGLDKLYFHGVHPLTTLILLHYLYTDGLLAVWDPRIGSALEDQFTKVAVSPAQIRSQLQHLSKSLRLQSILSSIEAHTKRSPMPSLSANMQSLLDAVQDTSKPATASINVNPLMPNVILELYDKNVHCHSVILRARSPFFAGLFDDEDWTTMRWRPDGTISVNLKHVKWRAFSFVIRYIYCGGDKEIFDVLDFVQNVDDVLEFMFEVMDIASELLLDRLGLLCSAVILQHINISNVCSVLTDATHFSAGQLVASLQGYMARNLETLMESRMLDDLHPHVVRQLSTFVQSQQERKLPLTRSNTMFDRAIEAHGDWLALQDIPQPIVRAVTKGALRQSPRLSPVALGSKRNGRPSYGPPSPSVSPRVSPSQVNTSITGSSVRAAEPAVAGDEVFMMDDEAHEDIPPISLSSPAPGPPVSQPVPFSANSPWKVKVSQISARSDLRTIMAEAETQRSPRPSLGPSPGRPQVTGSHSSQPPITPKLGQKALVSEPIRPKTDLSWRLPTSAQVSPGSSMTAPQTPPRITSSAHPTSTSRSSVKRPATDSLSASPPKPPTSTRTQTTSSLQSKGSLGPVFAPTKQAIGLSRRTSDSNSAWTTAPPITPAAEAGSSSSPPSFIAIQQQQRETVSTKPKKSLREIQEEEVARQAEEDFMKWWTAEEERIRLETQSTPPSQGTAGKKSKSARKAPFKGSMAKAVGKQEHTSGEQKSSRPHNQRRRSSYQPKEL